MNFATARVEEQPIPGTGVRVDFNLTPEDAIQGVFVEIESASTTSTTAPTALGGVVQVDTLTFPTKAAIVDADYVIMTDTAGDEWAAAAQLYPAAIAQVDTLQFAPKASMADGEYVIITDQSGAEWAIAADLTGASAAPVGTRWTAIPGAQKAQVDLSLAGTDEEVGDAFLAAFNLLVNFNTVVTLADEATDGLVSATQVNAGACAEPESFLSDDSAAGSVTIAQTTDGKDVSAAPTGARWGAVPAGQKTQVDLSAAVSENDVATAFKNALDVLAGATLTLAVVGADMTVTQPARGAVVNPEPFNADDSGVGTITTAATTPGVDAAVDTTAETVTLLSDPGWLTGKPVTPTSTGALPAVLTGAVVYAIRVSAGVYQFASTLANALAGTALNFADQGAAGATMTFTASGSTIGYLFNSIEKETDATLTTSILSTDVYDLNLAAADSFMVAQLGFDFSVKTTNRIFIKPSVTFDGFTLPAQFLPHMTLRIDDPTIKITSAKVTRRGVV